MNPVRKILIGGAMTAAAITGGAIGASFIGSAGAATPSTTTPAASTPAPPSSSSSAPSSADPSSSGHAPGKPDFSHGGHQANGKTEAVLTGDTLAKATAAAKAAQPGATVQRAETDAEGAAYEVHMAKADGSPITVKLDSSFKVTSTIDGMG